MGHIRLGRLRRTRRWRQVVALLEDGGNIDEIADASLAAAEWGLRSISRDPGFVSALTNILKFIEGARSDDLESGMRKNGFAVEKDSLALICPITHCDFRVSAS